MIAPIMDCKINPHMRKPPSGAPNLKSAQLEIRVVLRGPQHMHAKLVPRPTPWPTGLAPLGPFCGAKFSRLGPDPASFVALKFLRRVPGPNTSRGGSHCTLADRGREDEAEMIGKRVHKWREKK